MELKLYLPFIAFTLVCMTLASLFVYFRVKEGASPKALIFKTLASATFVSGGLYALAIQSLLDSAFSLILLGFVCAMVGDIFIDLRHIYREHEKYYLNAGIIFFTISFIMFMVGIIVLFKDLEKFSFMIIGATIIALLIAIINLLVEKPLKLNFGSYRTQVSIFACFEAFVAVLSLAICFYIPGVALFAVGAIMLLAGDMVLCQYLFKESAHEKLMIILNHILYYGGELLVMSYLFFQLI